MKMAVVPLLWLSYRKPSGFDPEHQTGTTVAGDVAITLGLLRKK
jgi:hypothetical protein